MKATVFQSPEDYLKDYDAYKAGKRYKVIRLFTEVNESTRVEELYLSKAAYVEHLLSYHRSGKSHEFSISVVDLVHKFKNINL